MASTGARPKSKQFREAGPLIIGQLGMHATWHSGEIGCTIRVSFMLTSRGRESFGGPDCVLCWQKVNALLRGGRSDSRLDSLLACAGFCMHEPCSVLHTTPHGTTSQRQNACTAAINIQNGQRIVAGVIFCSQEVNAFEANGPISAPAFVRLRLARPAATAQSPRSTGWQTDCRRSRR